MVMLIIITFGQVVTAEVETETGLTLKVTRHILDDAASSVALEFAEHDQGRTKVLTGGLDGTVILLDYEQENSKAGVRVLSSGVSHTMNAASWHPSGHSALIVGDQGVLLRYNTETGTLEHVEGANHSVLWADLSSVAWNQRGDIAWIGTKRGDVYRYTNDSLTSVLSDLGGVQDIACLSVFLRSECMFVTQNSGILLSDREGTISSKEWFAISESWNWLTGVCATDRPVCVIAGGDTKYATIVIDSADVNNSQASEVANIMGSGAPVIDLFLTQEKDVMGVTSDSRIVWFHTSDSEYNDPGTDVYPFIEGSELSELNEIIDSQILTGWMNPTVDGDFHGWMITKNGHIVVIDPSVSGGLVSATGSTIVFLLVIIAVPGTILGLLWMYLPGPRRWAAERRKRKRGKRGEKIAAETPRRGKR